MPPEDNSTIVEIPLSQGKVAIIDAADYELVMTRRWHACHVNRKHWYAYTSLGAGGRLGMHQLLIQPAPGMWVDHKNGDGLDNRRSNLRETTPSGNNRNCRMQRNNSSGYKGVRKGHRPGYWRAIIYVDGRTIHLGGFTNLIEAARAYDAAARRYYGEFAKLNFPD